MRGVCCPGVSKLVVAAGVGILVLLPWRVPVALAAPPALPDPVPLRRLLISPERLSVELQRVRQGTLLQMPRDEFEARVAEAARAGEALKNPPRLVEARYRARLLDAGLVGTGQWTVINPNGVPGILPLQPFNLALRKVQANNRDAILGELDGRSLGLLVEGVGTHSVSVAWSARGEPGPGSLRFELKVPSCVLTSFDLELPADRTVTLPGENGLLVGPQPASEPDCRTWRLLCSGTSPIDVLIRPTPAPKEPPPLVLARLRTRQKLAPYVVEANYDFSLKVFHRGLRELLCEGDPAQRPTAVSISAAEIDSWEVRPGPTPEAPFQLRVQLREPFQGDSLSLRVHCLAPAVPRDRWTSPTLRLQDAVVESESLSLQLAPEVRLEGWQPGGFEITEAVALGNGGQTLTLEAGLAGASSAQREEQGSSGGTLGAPRSALRTARPSARLRIQEPEYRARQISWWQIGPDTAALTVEIDYTVVDGQLFRLPVALPAHWNLDRVELSPSDLLRNWIPMPPENGQSLVIVNLQRPLAAPDTARLTLQLRPTGPWPAAARRRETNPSELALPFPEIVPQGARLWDGVLAIRLDPVHETTVHASLPPTALDDRIETEGATIEDRADARVADLGPLSSVLRLHPSPWGTQQPDYAYTFRGHPVSGTVTLRPRPPKIRAHCTSEIVLTSGRAALLTRLLLQPEIGNPDTIDLAVSTPVPDVWSWRIEGGRNAVQRMQRLRAAEILPQLLPLGAGTPLAAMGLSQPLLGQTSWWRLTLAQPLREPLLLETTFDLAGEGLSVDPATRLGLLASGTLWESLTLSAAASEAGTEDLEEKRWEVPLLGVLSAQRMDAEVRVYLAGAGLVNAVTKGLDEVTTASPAGVSAPWRTFRYGRFPVALSLHGRITAPQRPMAAWVERARLTTYVEPMGRLLNYYSFHVRNWKQATLPVRLPIGAQFLAAKLNGRWIACPPLGEPAAGVPVVQLPVATDSTTLHFEVVYSLEYPTGTLWTHAQAPVPVLPVAAVASRRTWCLPAGLMPLHEGLFQRQPGPNQDFAESGLGKAVQWASFNHPSGAFFAEDWRRRQRRLLAEAETQLRRRQRENRCRSLSEALHYLTYEAFKGQEILVIDGVALEAAGVQPAAPLPEPLPDRNNAASGREGESALPILEGLGLTCLPCRPAPLLTTQRQWASWQRARADADAVFSSVETAVSEAIAHGHDPSGRFQTAAEWLRNGNEGYKARPARDTEPDKTEAGFRGPLAPLPHPESWTEWEPIAGLPDDESLVVVRQDTLWGIAGALGGLLLLAWWWVQRRGIRGGYRLTLVWLAGSALGILWLPTGVRAVFWWPIVAGIALPAAWYLLSAVRSGRPVASTGPSAVAVIVSLALAAELAGQAAAPGPYTVWLLPGPPDTPEKLSALVPPELASELQTLARRGAAGLQGAFLLSAAYEGTVAGGSADFQASFHIHCFAEERTTLALPLGGVELQEALLDGSPAYPEALPAPQNGYALKVQGRGAHTVSVHFVARIPGSGEEQDLRFTIPELAQSQVTLRAPPGARYLQAVFCRGAQHITSAPTGVRLEADLGRVGTFHVHWRQGSSQPVPAAVRAEEVYYWDLQRSGSHLLGLLTYTVSRGAASELASVLPENMEVRQVEMVSPSPSGLGPRLKDWTITGSAAERRLCLEFQPPVTSGVQVLLELVPRLPLGPNAVLSLPTPEGVSFKEGLLAYRLQGLQASVTQFRGLREEDPAFFESHWHPAGTEYPGVPERAYRFLRAAGGAPSLHVELHAPTARTECVQDLTWYVGPHEADLRAGVKLTSAQKNVAYAEWEIPAELTVADVRGVDVRNWSREGTRLQVWLQRTVAETTLELTAWVVRPTEKPAEPFRLPRLAFLPAGSQATFVRVLAEKGWTLHAEHLQNLLALPDLRPVEYEQSYLSKQPVYGGVFQLRPAAAQVDLQTVSWVELRDQRAVFNAVIDYEIQARGPRTLTVRLRNWKGQDARLETPPGVVHHASRRDALTPAWILQLPSKLTGRIQFQLTGVLTLDGSGEVVMPEVTVDEAATAERWLAAVGPGLRPEEQRGLAVAADATAALGRWPTAAERLRHGGGLAWKIVAADWRLRLGTDFPLVESRLAQLLFEEQAVAVLDGRRWLHEATYLLYQESGTHLGVRLPNRAVLMTAALDGNEITPLQVGSGLDVQMAGGSGVRTLRLCWVFDAGRERLDVPRLEKPRLENIFYPPAEQRLPTLWTIYLPPGYRLASTKGATLSTSRIECSLNRAAAQLLASSLLAPRATGKMDDWLSRQLLAAQVQFYKNCREADYELAFGESLRAHDAGAGRLAARLRKLQADNKRLSETDHFVPIRTRAETQSASYPRPAGNGTGPADAEAVRGEDVLAEQGTPRYGQTSDDNGELEVRLNAVRTEQIGHALGYSGLLLVLLCIAWMLPSYPRAVAWLWASWPEQIITFGGLAWLAWGANLISVLLVILAVLARLLYLGRWLVPRLRRPRLARVESSAT